MNSRHLLIKIWNVNSILGAALVFLHLVMFSPSLYSIVVSTIELMFLLLGSVISYLYKKSTVRMYGPLGSIV